MLLDLVSKYPDMDKHLGVDSSLVHNKVFDRAVVKIQRGDEGALSTAEAKTVKAFLLSREEPSAESVNSSTGTSS